MGAVQNSCAYVIIAILQNSKPVLFFVVGYSVTKLCPTLCDPMDCSMPGFPVLHCLQEFAQAHGYWIADAFSIHAYLYTYKVYSLIFIFFLLIN